MRSLPSLVLILLSVLPLVAAVDSLPPPSMNASRKGTYQVATGIQGINYWVCVAGDFTPEKPAGIHVFFHGMGGQSMARNFALWQPFLQAGCIGINLEYADGNPHQDKEGKAEAARLAVRQVLADYPVAIGRGAITAFSAGGSPVGAWFRVHGQKATAPSADWPFSHINVFGAGLNCGDEITAVPTSFFRAMGDGEERMAPGLCRYLSSRTAVNLADARPTASRDAIFWVTQGRGHTILPDEVLAAARCYLRSATAHAPFLYRPVDVAADIGAVIDAANGHRFAEALERYGKAKGVKPVLKEVILEQMAVQVELCTTVAREDPALARIYIDACSRQFEGTELVKRLAAATGAQEADAKRWRTLHERWRAQFGQFFTGKGIALDAKAVPYLEEVGKLCGAQSTIGMMTAKYLEFAPKK